MSSINCCLHNVGENEPALVNLRVQVLELGQTISFFTFGLQDGHDGAFLQERVALYLRHLTQ